MDESRRESHDVNPESARPEQPGASIETAPSANMALIFSVLGLLCCGPLAVAGIVFAKKAKQEIEQSDGQYGGDTQATIGQALGWVAVVIWGLLLVASLVSAVVNPTSTTTSTTVTSTTVVVPPTYSPTPITATASPVTSAKSPSPTEEYKKTATMPNVTCMNLQDAQNKIQDAGVFYSRSHDATGRDRNQVNDSNWLVVAQHPPPGATFGEGEAVLEVVKYGEQPNPC